MLPPTLTKAIFAVLPEAVYFTAYFVKEPTDSAGVGMVKTVTPSTCTPTAALIASPFLAVAEKVSR